MTAIDLEPVQKLTKDLKQASVRLSPKEARYIVDLYYQIQDYRIQASNQVRQMEGEPTALLSWMLDNFETLERNIRNVMNAWTDGQVVGRWMKSISGIGPVLAGALLAHLDVTKTKTAGGFWRFAGLDPSIVWEKGQKRPYNGDLKTICAFKLGECFVKVSKKEHDFYGHVYRERKALEIQRNEQGLFADQAQAILAKRKIGHETDAYKAYSQGKLPPAQLHARARRYAVKLFLSQ